jgi:hypothetical protein
VAPGEALCRLRPCYSYVMYRELGSDSVGDFRRRRASSRWPVSTSS